MFINRYKQLDIVKDHKIFLNKIEELKLYIVEFDKDGIIKSKVYPLEYIVKSKDQKPIIVITYNKCICSTNNGI